MSRVNHLRFLVMIPSKPDSARYDPPEKTLNILFHLFKHEKGMATVIQIGLQLLADYTPDDMSVSRRRLASLILLPHREDAC